MTTSIPQRHNGLSRLDGPDLPRFWAHWGRPVRSGRRADRTRSSEGGGVHPGPRGGDSRWCPTEGMPSPGEARGRPGGAPRRSVFGRSRTAGAFGRTSEATAVDVTVSEKRMTETVRLSASHSGNVYYLLSAIVAGWALRSDRRDRSRCPMLGRCGDRRNRSQVRFPEARETFSPARPRGEGVVAVDTVRRPALPNARRILGSGGAPPPHQSLPIVTSPILTTGKGSRRCRR